MANVRRLTREGLGRLVRAEVRRLNESQEDEEQSSNLRDAHLVDEMTQAVLEILTDFMVVPSPDNDLDAHNAARQTVSAAMISLTNDLTGMY
jgi:hypothetical protein